MKSIAVLAVVVAAALVGCGSDALRPGQPRLAENASDEYREAMADGEVTEEEYTAGYRRFVACLEEAGYAVIEAGRTGLHFDYFIPDEAVQAGDDQRCYDQEFWFIDEYWQTAHPRDTGAGPTLRACLEEAGLPTDGNEEELKARMVENGLDVFECLGL